MPPKKKRTHATENEEDNARKRMCVSASNKRSAAEASFSPRRCTSLFNKYASEADALIGPDGMEKFCLDLGIDPENIIMLVLAFRMDAKHMGFFTFDEWNKGMTEMQCDSIEKLKNKFGNLSEDLDKPVTFKKIYRFAFDFSLEIGNRSLDKPTAMALMTLLLEGRWSLLPEFMQFLEQAKFKGMNKDQWYNVYEFSRNVKPDLSDYDEDGAWPVLLDEFVEWYHQQMTTGQPGEVRDCSRDKNTTSCKH